LGPFLISFAIKQASQRKLAEEVRIVLSCCLRVGGVPLGARTCDRYGRSLWSRGRLSVLYRLGNIVLVRHTVFLQRRQGVSVYHSGALHYLGIPLAFLWSENRVTAGAG